MARRNPVRTLSWSEKMHQIAVAAQNHAAAALERRKCSLGAQTPIHSTNTTLTMVAIAPLSR
jgi:hypothetical protein